MALGKGTRPLGRGQQLRWAMSGAMSGGAGDVGWCGWCAAASVLGTIGCVLFVGRARALSRLLGAVEDAAAGYARLVLISGEAGIGKTTLVAGACHDSRVSHG